MSEEICWTRFTTPEFYKQLVENHFGSWSVFEGKWPIWRILCVCNPSSSFVSIFLILFQRSVFSIVFFWILWQLVRGKWAGLKVGRNWLIDFFSQQTLSPFGEVYEIITPQCKYHNESWRQILKPSQLNEIKLILLHNFLFGLKCII